MITRLLQGITINAGMPGATGGEDGNAAARRATCAQGGNGAIGDMQEGQDGAFAQGADVVVRGIAGHEQQFGPGSFETARAANEVRQRIIAAAADVRGAVGDLRIAVDEDVQMILIAACSGVVGDFLVEVYGRLRSHAANDAKGFHALTPLRVHGDCSADRRARPCCVLR